MYSAEETGEGRRKYRPEVGLDLWLARPNLGQRQDLDLDVMHRGDIGAFSVLCKIVTDKFILDFYQLPRVT